MVVTVAPPDEPPDPEPAQPETATAMQARSPAAEMTLTGGACPKPWTGETWIGASRS
jgi:hypothetical protein